MIEIDAVVADSLSKDQRDDYFKASPDCVFCFNSTTMLYEAIEKLLGYTDYNSFEVVKSNDYEELFYLGCYL